MTTQGLEAQSGDTAWSGLLALAPEPRVSAMRERYEQLLALPDTEMESKLEDMIVAEYTLDSASLHSFTASRLRALLGIAEQDVERARRVASAGDHIFTRMPGEMAMRRTVTVQTIARTELTAQEVELLRELLPSLLQQLPRLTASAMPGRATASVQQTGGGSRKPWWKVW
jgi:hypothetical protein